MGLWESYKDIFKTDESQGNKKEERTIKDRKREVKIPEKKVERSKVGITKKIKQDWPEITKCLQNIHIQFYAMQICG